MAKQLTNREATNQ